MAVQKNPAFLNVPYELAMNEACCADPSGSHITIVPIIKVRNSYPGIMAVVKHHL